MKNIYGIIDLDSGEILDEANEHEGYKKINLDNRQKQREYLSNNKPNFLKESSFVKSFDAVEDYLRFALTEQEHKVLNKLSHYIGYNDCILRSYVKKDSIPLSLQDMGSITNYQYDNIRKIIKSLISKGTMNKTKLLKIYPESQLKDCTVYFINPFIYFRGTDINKKILEYFDNIFWQKLHDDYKGGAEF